MGLNCNWDLCLYVETWPLLGWMEVFLGKSFHVPKDWIYLLRVGLIVWVRST